MKKGLSEYKFGRLAVEALRNALRLHFDSIVLFKNRSYPSAFQLSVLALEEFAKASWVDDYYFYAKASSFPDPTFEQSWMELLYRHPEKQKAFFGRGHHDFSPIFVDFVQRNGLELKKQRATYVGLDRFKGRANVASRISTPRSITGKDARQMISLINATFVEVHRLITLQGDYFDISGMDRVVRQTGRAKLRKWPHKTGLKSRRWLQKWMARYQARTQGDRQP